MLGYDAVRIYFGSCSTLKLGIGQLWRSARGIIHILRCGWLGLGMIVRLPVGRTHFGSSLSGTLSRSRGMAVAAYMVELILPQANVILPLPLNLGTIYSPPN